MSINQLKNIFRIGVCSTSDPVSGTITVVFEDRDGMVSGDIPVMSPGGWGRSNTIPQPGETVACLFLANGVSEGICLGVIDDDDFPGTQDQRGIYFEDGSFVYYDRSTQKLMVKAVGGVSLEGNVTITGNLTVDGSITRGGGAL